MGEVDWCHLFRMYWHELSIQDVLVYEHMKETLVYVCRRKKKEEAITTKMNVNQSGFVISMM